MKNKNVKFITMPKIEYRKDLNFEELLKMMREERLKQGHLISTEKDLHTYSFSCDLSVTKDFI